MEYLKEKIHVEIELLRKNLIKSGMKNGLTAPETLDLSQELDKLINLQICSYQNNRHSIVKSESLSGN